MSVHNLRFPLTMYASLPRAFPFLSRAPWSSNCSRSVPSLSFLVLLIVTSALQAAKPIGVNVSLSSSSMPSVQHGSRYQCAIPLCEIVK